jgi:hypothetical protein
MSVYEKIVLRWKAQVLSRRPAVGLYALDQFEEAHGLKLPAALRKLLLLSNGLERGEYDRVSHIRFWPLEEIASVKECAPELATSVASDCLVFADYSVWAHAYVVSPKAGSVSVIGGRESIYVSESIDDFLLMYLNDKVGIA